MNLPTTPKTILLVEPSDVICDLLQILLVRVGYDVLTATNAADAIHLAHETPKIDLLLSGIELPDMRGEHLAGEITALHPSVSVLFASDWVYPMEATVPFALLRKPFTMEQLRAAVHRAVQMPPASAEMAHAA